MRRPTLLFSALAVNLATASPLFADTHRATQWPLGPFNTPESPGDLYKIPTISESAAQARRILHAEARGTLSTVFPNDTPSSNPHISERRPADVAGSPIGLPEYIADCEGTGDPTILAIGIATSFRNAAAGSNVSLAIASHPSSESHPGARRDTDDSFKSPAAHPRFSLQGYLERIDDADLTAKNIERCFTERHPDARLWTPGNPVHESYWARLVVKEVYWIGGFGDRAYIGWIPEDVWRDAV